MNSRDRQTSTDVSQAIGGDPTVGLVVDGGSSRARVHTAQHPSLRSHALPQLPLSLRTLQLKPFNSVL